jgi:hypothetical protein
LIEESYEEPDHTLSEEVRLRMIRDKYQYHANEAFETILELYTKEVMRTKLQIDREQYALPDDLN